MLKIGSRITMVKPIITDELNINICGDVLIVKEITEDMIYFKHEDVSKINYLIGSMTIEEFNNYFIEIMEE